MSEVPATPYRGHGDDLGDAKAAVVRRAARYAWSTRPTALLEVSEAQKAAAALAVGVGRSHAVIHSTRKSPQQPHGVPTPTRDTDRLH